METHVYLANQAIRSMKGLTAFSALPDAPVLPLKQRQQRLSTARIAAWRARGAPDRSPRMRPATTTGPICS